MEYVQILEVTIGVILGGAGVAGVVWKVMLPKIDERIREHLASNAEDHDDFKSRILELEDKKGRDYETLTRLNDNDKIIISTLLDILKYLQKTTDSESITESRDGLEDHFIKNL
jgi:hypothetical protein